MRNLKCTQHSGDLKHKICTNDISIDKFSGELWLGTSNGLFLIDLDGILSSQIKAINVKRILYLNIPCVCFQQERSIVLMQIPDQTLELQKFDEDIVCSSFSPDQSVGLVLTASLKLCIMSSSLELMGQVDINELNIGREHFVNVGWGSKETQFKGKKKTTETITLLKDNKLKTLAHFPSEITWREDGQYFAVLTTENQSLSERVLRIFDANGEFKSKGEVMQNIETGLCWRPKVQLIATSRRNGDRSLNLLFFELNGLQHGEMELLLAPRANSYRVEKIIFEENNGIMAILFTQISPSSYSPPFVRLYTTSNYHWYIKMELPLISLGEEIINDCHISIAFGNPAEESTSKLIVTCTESPKTILRTWSLISSIDKSCSIAHNSSMVDSSLVAIIDGNVVRLTDFAYTTVPPPMCGSKLIFPTTTCVSSISLPGLWTAKQDKHWPILIQLGSASSLFWLEMSTGWQADQKRVELIQGYLFLEREQVAKNVAPFVQQVLALTSDCVSYEENRPRGFIIEGLLHGTWIHTSHFCFISNTGKFVGMISRISDKSQLIFRIRCLAQIKGDLFRHFAGLVACPNGQLGAQLNDGEVIFVDTQQSEGKIISADDPELHDAMRLPFVCDQLYTVEFFCAAAANISGSGDGEKKRRRVLVGLQSSSHRLCAVCWGDADDALEEPHCVIKMISSLTIHPHFLLITSLYNQLVCIPFGLPTLQEFHSLISTIKNRLSASDDLLVPNSLPEQRFQNPITSTSGDAFSRSLELGATIVTAVPGGTKVVLQMPRGNLEDIHPRPLVFNDLGPMFDSCQHSSTIEILRRNRIDFNLLYDYNPKKFLSNITNFVNQVKSPEHITLMVSDLLEEDVTETVYNGYFGVKQIPVRSMLAFAVSKMKENVPKSTLTESYSAAKLNLVCDALLKVMANDQRKFLLPILTCCTKKQPAEVERGLMMLKEFRANGDMEAWDKGLRHLQYYITPVALFHTALGTYDLELAEAMAERTQIDPKEYQPCLTELRSLFLPSPDSSSAEVSSAAARAFQHARIDLILGRYHKALQGLWESGEVGWDELLALMQKYKLFSQALDLVKPATSQFSLISRAWADSLVASQRIVAAGEVHLRANHFLSASSLFVAVNSSRLWRLTVDRSRSEPPTDDEAERLSDDEVKRQALRLALNLQSIDRHTESIYIYTDYLQNFEAAVRVASEGCLWSEAHRLASHVPEKDLVSSVIFKQAVQTYKKTTECISLDSQEFYRKFERLIELRADAQAKAADKEFGDEAFDDTESELFSETSSVVSGNSCTSRESSASSRMSGRSRKTRRKRERKKWTTKVGSKYEEIAIIQFLYQYIESFQRLLGGLPELIDELWRVGRTESARSLVRQVNSILLDQRACLNIVWCQEITGAEVGEEDLGKGESQIKRRYPFHEFFLLFPPNMTVKMLDSDFL